MVAVKQLADAGQQLPGVPSDRQAGFEEINEAPELGD